MGVQALRSCGQYPPASKNPIPCHGADNGRARRGAKRGTAPTCGARQEAPQGARIGGFASKNKLSPLGEQ